MQVQNAVDFLKMIGALDENENLTKLGMFVNVFGKLCYGEFHTLILILSFLLHGTGRYLSMLPVDPKLGKMLIMGAVFRCLDPVLTIVSGLSVRDPFLLPQDKKDVSSLFFHPLVLLLFILALWTMVHLAPVCFYITNNTMFGSMEVKGNEG